MNVFSRLRNSSWPNPSCCYQMNGIDICLGYMNLRGILGGKRTIRYESISDILISRFLGINKCSQGRNIFVIDFGSSQYQKFVISLICISAEFPTYTSCTLLLNSDNIPSYSSFYQAAHGHPMEITPIFSVPILMKAHTMAPQQPMRTRSHPIHPRGPIKAVTHATCGLSGTFACDAYFSTGLKTRSMDLIDCSQDLCLLACHTFTQLSQPPLRLIPFKTTQCPNPSTPFSCPSLSQHPFRCKTRTITILHHPTSIRFCQQGHSCQSQVLVLATA